jgi:hypothetical protein
MRINITNALAIADVLHGHIFQKIGFTHASLSNNIHMATAIIGFDAENPLLVSKVCLGKEIDFVVHVTSVVVNSYVAPLVYQ